MSIQDFSIDVSSYFSSSDDLITFVGDPYGYHRIDEAINSSDSETDFREVIAQGFRKYISEQGGNPDLYNFFIDYDEIEVFVSVSVTELEVYIEPIYLRFDVYERKAFISESEEEFCRFERTIGVDISDTPRMQIARRLEQLTGQQNLLGHCLEGDDFRVYYNEFTLEGKVPITFIPQHELEVHYKINSENIRNSLSHKFPNMNKHELFILESVVRLSLPNETSNEFSRWSLFATPDNIDEIIEISQKGLNISRFINILLNALGKTNIPKHQINAFKVANDIVVENGLNLEI